MSAADAGRGSTKGASGLPGQEVAGNQGAENTGTPVTSGNALQGKGASPGDVPQQNRGQQTGAEAAQSGGRVPPNAQSAEERLAQARKLDKAGHETECQAEVTKAKAAFGVE
ncbi:MAG TPA: hypothetical protein VM639_22105 [Dongiaceae bacterium]|nr:hypothetical protein [Dongiaceae bacterium]